MLALLKLYILVNLHYTLIKCFIPGTPTELSVRTMDEKLVERKRQDTVEMCRIFTEETEKLEKINEFNKLHQTKKKHMPVHRRAKRQIGLNAINPMYLDDAKRVESIVDKVYDDLLEQGEKVNYRRMDVEGLNRNSTVSGRRFDFAPNVLTAPPEYSTENKSDPFNMSDSFSAKTPRFNMSIVPYFIDQKTYDTHLSAMIVKAFDYFEKATCIRLQRLHDRPTDKESLQNVEWVYITNPTGIKQCVHSNTQTLVKGVQMVVFGYECMSLGEILHEIMHVLGFPHEHLRPDRDQFVSIMWENIKPGYKKYFQRSEIPVAEKLPYDYASVLHYPSRAFSKNGQVTIVAQNGIKIGQREGLSEIDVQKINYRYSGECVKRNRQYLLTTCPSVIQSKPESQKATKKEIEMYYEKRLWAYGIVNYKLKDMMEFTRDEKENIQAVIRHIETETCIEFRDLTSEFTKEQSDSSDESPQEVQTPSNASSGGSVADEGSKNSDVLKKENEKSKQTDKSSFSNSESSGEAANNKTDVDVSNNVSDNEVNDPSNRLRSSKKYMKKKKYIPARGKKTALKKKQLRKSSKFSPRGHANKRPGPPISPSRRHASNIIMFTRSPKPGCSCPKTPGIPADAITIEVNADCFNSVNNLLHLFVHLLGLDHQHNSHDRDSYLHIVWDELTDDLKKEMKQKLPPAAAAGFDYDYQSVMHYPWLQIKNGRTNIMYPIWNDGWAMGNWQGLSSVDVQKLNLLYNKQCGLRRQQAEASGRS